MHRKVFSMWKLLVLHGGSSVSTPTALPLLCSADTYQSEITDTALLDICIEVPLYMELCVVCGAQCCCMHT